MFLKTQKSKIQSERDQIIARDSDSTGMTGLSAELNGLKSLSLTLSLSSPKDNFKLLHADMANVN